MPSVITEKDALDALPSHGFVRAYCQYAAVQTTAPLAYHIGVAMSMLAVTCPLGYGTRYAINQRPNLFVMLAGRSGDDQKSTAIEIGREILFEACPTLIGDQPGSSEGMIESLSKQPTQLLIYKEMGKLLASTQRGYLEPLKALLTDLSDCSSQQRVKEGQTEGREQCHPGRFAAFVYHWRLLASVLGKAHGSGRLDGWILGPLGVAVRTTGADQLLACWNHPRTGCVGSVFGKPEPDAHRGLDEQAYGTRR